MSEAVVSAEGLRYAYGESGFALDVAHFDVPVGTVTAIIGPNGAGKSTLLRIAAGVLSPQTGRVQLDEKPLAALNRRDVAKRLGYLPQETRAQFDYTVGELVALGRFPHVGGFATLTAADEAVVRRAVMQTEMDTLRDRPLSHLSGGERKRAFLASVLAQEPGVLLMDEPTASLDIHHQARFFRLLRELAAGGMAVAVVTHEVNLAALFADRLILMARGAIFARGKPRDVLTASTVSELYGDDILLHAHPQSGLPVVLPAQTSGEGSL